MATNIWMIGHEVELPEMLAGRERRAAIQQQMQQQYPGTLVCFTLNIAGPVKVFPLSEEVFLQTEDRIITRLWQQGFSIRNKREETALCGWEAYLAVEGDALEIKKALLVLEEEDPAGRLYDIDVLRPDGSKISREELGLPPRSCLICGKETIACARSRAHTVEELQQKTAEMLIDALRGKRMSSYMIGRLCRQAMLLEVYTTPKPGLVDRNNSGAHRDMDVALFERSTEVLEPFFVEYAVTGRELYEESPEEILRCIRPIGIRAEEAMFAATCGVNTHKGMIFSLGILATAVGYCLARNDSLRHGFRMARNVSLDEILKVAAQIAAPAWRDDFRNMKLDVYHIPTAGEKQFYAHGIGGIRKEAADGFPSVVHYSWPILANALDRGYDWNQAGAMAILNLMAYVTDTNMVKRSSLEEQRAMQEKIRAMLEAPEGVTSGQVLALDQEFIEKNLSPGGCADLLALTYFLYELAMIL